MKKNITCLAVLMMACFGSVGVFAGLNDGLVAHYQFNSNINDASANGNNGTAYGGTFSRGIIGTCFSLNPGEYAVVPDAPSLNPSQLTVTVWVNFSRLLEYGNNQFLIAKGDDGTQGSYYLSQNGDQFHFYLGANRIDQVHVAATELNLETNRWYHVAGTYDGTDLKIYVNGALSNTTPANIAIGNTDSLHIGYQDVPSWEYYFGGRLDEIRIYNRALSAAEIQALASLSNPTFWSGNGHYYAFVPGNFTWQVAKALAESQSFMGMTGYLATITSAAENNFINSIFNNGQPSQFVWLGGIEPADNGAWFWVTGSESGLQFSNYKAPTAPYDFANWGGVEPNGAFPNEDYLALNIGSVFVNVLPGEWLDAQETPWSGDPVVGYIVEFGVSPTACVGDFDQDGDVDGSDLAILIQEFGPAQCAVVRKTAGNPVMDAGEPGAWDAAGAARPSVIKETAGYRMWYTGSDGVNYGVGLATSDDGLNWNRFAANPVLSTGSAGDWDDYRVSSSTVIKDGDVYKMWYTGHDGSRRRIGYATSADGLSWAKHGGNPVLNNGPAGSWDSEEVCFPTVIKDNGIYKMWYYGWNGASSRIGYATSADGIVWAKYASNPVLQGGSAGSWDAGGVDHPMVVKDGVEYKMWYGGSDGSYSRTGYAESNDGIIWTKHASNPVIDVGQPSTWDSTRAWAVAAVSNGSTYEIWYTGDDISKWRIGHALTGCMADFNGDGNTDSMDVTAFGPHFGRDDCQ